MQIKDIFSLGELFEKVQMQNIFPDNKTFVDCTPNTDLSSIHERYEAEKNGKNFNLSLFIHENFTLPKEYSTDYVSDTTRPISQHLEMLWNVLTREPEKSKNSLIPLPHPYIVPGGRFREIYYWDSYFTMLGLKVPKRIDLIQNMIDNFCYLIDTIGYIPNGNRRYYLGRSQPPFFACMVKLLSEEMGENPLIHYLPQLEKEYNFWMRGKNELNDENLTTKRLSLLPDGNVLNHYWDEFDTPRPESYKEDVELTKSATDKDKMYRHLRAAAESGWDFSSRWFRDKKDFSSIHTTDIIPVDLNCLLLNLEQTIAEAYQLINDKISSEKYQALAGKRKEAIDTYCWNEQKGFYFDYDYVAGKQKDSLTLAAAFPLFFKIASKEQARKVAKILEEKFISNGGLVTTTETTRQQWDSPNGWAPLQWIAIQGLLNYEYFYLAKDIAARWININKKVYENTGKMMEKYNVVSTDSKAGGGEYPAQDGFGWTNGVYLALDNWLQIC
ncbi:MAG: alpha,alpha-trehalase TreA [Bacteroidota bacterium]|nr:alpha,alpha-trehalase TreA [Bacteroidota bacterium]